MVWKIWITSFLLDMLDYVLKFFSNIQLDGCVSAFDKYVIEIALIVYMATLLKDLAI